ncbi:MAG: hypothetical protein CMG75_02760 [Candidatus Marinimicrobia bacterium]|nr:hypothetical protein [Candidatus Neomarinimicrobiota bacterium]|tara:strand:- start:28747 stop:29130 length:384 start_codon:yes stop_codon:yes gene_type:complete
MKYGYQRTINYDFEKVDKKIRETLMEEGFGILTEIDVKEAFKEKLQIDFQRFRILGACNPILAHKALTTELEVGMLMPCNVVIWENSDGSVTLSAGDAEILLSVAEADLNSIACEANQRLQRAVDAV